jgi:transposase-like protein
MGRARPRRRRRTETERRGILQRLAASGLSCSEFCQREGLALSSLHRWRARAVGAAEHRFVDLLSTTPAPSVSAGSWTLELELPGDVRLRIRR